MSMRKRGSRRGVGQHLVRLPSVPRRVNGGESRRSCVDGFSRQRVTLVEMKRPFDHQRDAWSVHSHVFSESPVQKCRETLMLSSPVYVLRTTVPMLRIRARYIDWHA